MLDELELALKVGAKRHEQQALALLPVAIRLIMIASSSAQQSMPVRDELLAGVARFEAVPRIGASNMGAKRALQATRVVATEGEIILIERLKW